jgi:hypothetical protein
VDLQLNDKTVLVTGAGQGRAGVTVDRLPITPSSLWELMTP